MPFRFEDRVVNKVSELLEFISSDQQLMAIEPSAGEGARDPLTWYRGIPSTQLTLVPTLHRKGIPIEQEVYLLNRFRQNAHEFLEHRPQGQWEWMLLARHHGLPSRLLDWTENVLVGLFFACNGYNLDHCDDDGVLWCLSPWHLNQLASNQTLISDLPPMFQDGNFQSRDDEFLNNYKIDVLGISSQPIAPAAAISERTNKRIQAQLGVFTIHHTDGKPIDDWGTGSHLWRYLIPTGAKSSIRSELYRAGITRLALFPDLDSAVDEAMRGF